MDYSKLVAAGTGEHAAGEDDLVVEELDDWMPDDDAGAHMPPTRVPGRTPDRSVDASPSTTDARGLGWENDSPGRAESPEVLVQPPAAPAPKTQFSGPSADRMDERRIPDGQFGADSPASLEPSDIEGEIDALLEELGMDEAGSPVAQTATAAAPHGRGGPSAAPRGLVAGSQRPPSPIRSPTRGDGRRDVWKSLPTESSAPASGATPSELTSSERDEDRPAAVYGVVPSPVTTPPSDGPSPPRPPPPPPHHRGKAPGGTSPPGGHMGSPSGGPPQHRESCSPEVHRSSREGSSRPAPALDPAGGVGPGTSLLSSPWVPLPARAGRLERLAAAHAHHWRSGLDARAKGSYTVSEEARRILEGSGLAADTVGSLLRALRRGPSSLVAAGTTASHPVREALGVALASEHDARGPIRRALSSFARHAPPHEALTLVATLASALEWPHAVALRQLRAQGGGLAAKSADAVCADVTPLLPRADGATTTSLATALGDMWTSWRERWAQRASELGDTDLAAAWLRPAAANPAPSESSRQRALQSLDGGERGRVEGRAAGRRGRRGRKGKSVLGAIVSLLRGSARTEPGSPSPPPTNSTPAAAPAPAVGMAEAVDEWEAAWGASAAWQCPAWGKLVGALAQDLEREDTDPKVSLRQLYAAAARLALPKLGEFLFLYPPRTRATLAHLWLRVSCPPHRLRCTVSRGSPLRDLESALRRDRHLEGEDEGEAGAEARGAGMTWPDDTLGEEGEELMAAAVAARAVYFIPVFRASFGDGDDDAGGAVELGEGYGLRKELFAGAAGDAATPWSAWEERLAARASTEEGRATVTMDGEVPSSLAPGAQVTLQRADAGGSAVTRRVVSVLGPARFAVDRQLPETAAGWTVTLRQPRQAVLQFHRPSESLWVAPLRRGGAGGVVTGAAEALGFLMGSAVLNRCTVPLRLAPPAWEALAHGLDAWRPRVVDLLLFDPAIRSSLAAAVGAGAETLSALCEAEGVPGEPDAVHYLAHAAETTLKAEPWPLLRPLCAGFHRAFPLRLIREMQLGGADLCRLVCGEAPDGLGALLVGGEPQTGAVELRVQDYFLVAADPAVEPTRPLGRALWAAVDGLDADGKRRFLHFVTGVDSLPAPGTEVLRIDLPYTALDVEEHRNMLGMLPTAHTCDNVLELPNYWESLVAVHLAEEGREFEGEEALLADERRRLQRRLHALVAEKLRVAMSHGHGYGLDDVQPGQH